MTPFWVTALQQEGEAGNAAVLVTIASQLGSAPREAGAKMVVTASTTAGTIGGGRLELECITEARMMLRGSQPALMRDYPLGPALGQCCGGQVSVLFEAVLQPAWRVAVFGAGHVGRAVVALLSDLPCQVRLLDTRPAMLHDVPSGVVTVLGGDIEVANLVPGSHVLVMTHDHQLDFAIIASCLTRSDLGAIGLIGSKTKRARFAARLRAQGHDPARVICPIGVPGVGSKLAAEIAISVVAQLLQLRDHTGHGMEPARMTDAACDPACATCAAKPVS